MKLKLTKLKDSDTAEYKNNIRIGTEVVGELIHLPKVGECFYLGNMRTSTVKEIISLNKFRTNNSIYQLEEL